MTLREYLTRSDTTISEFARQIGVGRMTVHRWVKAQRYPRPDMMDRIMGATRGNVTALDFLQALKGSRP